jgi:hypothetical protein
MVAAPKAVRVKNKLIESFFMVNPRMLRLSELPFRFAWPFGGVTEVR